MKQDHRRARAIAIAATETQTRAAWLRLGLVTGLAIAAAGMVFSLIG
jgi:hypothetical protein